MRRTEVGPREGDRHSPRWWMEHARSRALCFRSALLSVSRCRIMYLDTQATSLLFASSVVRCGLSIAHIKWERRGNDAREPCVTTPRT